MSLFERSWEQQADDLANARYDELEGEVLRTVRAKLAGRKIFLDTSDLEAAYCQAWHGVCLQIQRGVRVRNLTAMLVEITWRRAVDTYREMRPGRRVEVEIEGYGVEPDLAEQVDDQQKLRRLMVRLRERLNDKECEAVGLCWIHGYTRPEAARQLGVDEPAFQRIMDSATRKIGGIVAGIDARGCGDEEWARLLRAYALGALREDERDYARAEAHIADCETCRRYVRGLRGLAGIVPLPFLPVGGGHEAGILAHLESLFATTHGGVGAVAAAQGAGGVGGGLLGPLSGSFTIKAVVVVTAAGVAAVGVGSLHSRTHHYHAPRANVARAPIPRVSRSEQERLIARSPAASERGTPRIQEPRAAASHTTRPAAASGEEFGFEHTGGIRVRRRRLRPPPPVGYLASSTSHERQGGTGAPGEFGFE